MRRRTVLGTVPAGLLVRLDHALAEPASRIPAVTVVIASKGYPDNPSAGNLITGADGPGYLHAGTRLTGDGRLATSGGRAICCTALGDTLAQARTARDEEPACAMVKRLMDCSPGTWRGLS